MTSEPRSDLHGHDSLAAVRGVWSVDAVRSLGLTISVEVAASILGISRTKAYALAKDGDFPVKLVRVGRRYLVPVPALLDLLTGGRSPG